MSQSSSYLKPCCGFLNPHPVLGDYSRVLFLTLHCLTQIVTQRDMANLFVQDSDYDANLGGVGSWYKDLGDFVNEDVDTVSVMSEVT